MKHTQGVDWGLCSNKHIYSELFFKSNMFSPHVHGFFSIRLSGFLSSPKTMPVGGLAILIAPRYECVCHCVCDGLESHPGFIPTSSQCSKDSLRIPCDPYHSKAFAEDEQRYFKTTSSNLNLFVRFNDHYKKTLDCWQLLRMPILD